MKNLKLTQLILFALIVTMPLAYATDGYFSLGYGAKHKGVAGAGIGLHHYSLLNGNNAGLVQLGSSYHVGLSFFSPNRSYEVTGNPSGLPTTFGLAPGKVESESKLFLIPSIAANWKLSDQSAFGISIFGQGGMNTDYPTQTYHDQSESTTGVNLSQLMTHLNYAYQINEDHALGLAAVLAFQMFEAKGLTNFSPFSENPNALTSQGTSTSFGFGWKLAYLGQLSDDLSLGAVYSSRVNMSEFEEYAGLFAEGGDFDIPSSISLGLAYDISEQFTIMADYKLIQYSSVASISNAVDPMALPPAFLNPGGNPNNPNDYTPNPNHVPLGADAGSGFGWEDMSVIKLAVQYDTESWTWRGGVSLGSNPVRESEVMFNILAPGVIDNHIALGFSRKLSNNRSFDLSFNYALSNTVSGPNPFDFDPAQLAQGNFVPNQTIDLTMNQIDIEISYTF